MNKYIRLLRVHQWIKNLFVFAPAFFANKIFNCGIMLSSMLAFFAFSFAASSIYIFNDIKDVDFDRLHPKKKFRPIASGEISLKEAYTIALFCLAIAFSFVIFLPIECAIVLLIYIVMNTAYSIKLKHIAILDIFIISLGFILRLKMGGAAINLGLSEWILIMTFLLSMFLALAKRRDDCLLTENVRRAIDGYNTQFIDVSLAIMAAVLLVAYLMYCLSPEVAGRMGENVYLTFIFVVLGILRYLQRTFVFGDSGSPTIILINDRFIQLVIACWILVFSAIFILKGD